MVPLCPTASVSKTLDMCVKCSLLRMNATVLVDTYRVVSYIYLRFIATKKWLCGVMVARIVVDSSFSWPQRPRYNRGSIPCTAKFTLFIFCFWFGSGGCWVHWLSVSKILFLP